MHCVRIWVFVAQRIFRSSYVTLTFVTVCAAYTALCISVCTLWPLPCHSQPQSRWPRTAYISLLAQSHWSVLLSLWRHQRARVTAHHTSPSYLHLLLNHPSVPSCLSPSLATGCAVWMQHLLKNILAASTHSPHFLLHLLSPLLPVLPAWRGTQCECCTVIRTHFLSLPPVSLIFSRKILCKAFGLRPLSHVVYSDQRVDELTALPLLTQ